METSFQQSATYKEKNALREREREREREKKRKREREFFSLKVALLGN